MCGRYALMTPADEIASIFGAGRPIEFGRRFNIAPSQDCPVIRSGDGAREMILMRWGLIPRWSKKPDDGPRPINARSESAPDKPMFRHAFRRHRCIVPADGFYEWQKLDGGKQPMFIRIDGGRPFAMAALWERWTPESESDRDSGSDVLSFTILTTDANRTLRPLHDRMPVILDASDVEAWLDPSNEDVDALRAICRPFGDASTSFYPVSRAVNSPRNDSSQCIEPIEPGSSDPDSLFS